MCKVLNVKQVGKRPAADRVYVGRPSKWGNPFVIGRDGTRGEVIAKYRAWIVRQPALMAALHELRGKHLVCWCAPDRCHADVLIELGLVVTFVPKVTLRNLLNINCLFDTHWRNSLRTKKILHSSTSSTILGGDGLALEQIRPKSRQIKGQAAS